METAEIKETARVHFQKPLSYLRYLPYYDRLCKEAEEQLEAIKAGLGRSLLLREIQPSLVHWTTELDKYIGLYGFRFSKEDHIFFITLTYELILLPNLEPNLVKNFGQKFKNLVCKMRLISRKDLTLDWRRLYDLYKYVAYKNLDEDGLFLFPSDITTSLESVIQFSRTYFPVTATREILEELRPLMCPWDTSFGRALHCLNLFAPCMLPPEEHEHGFKLWFDEVVYWWLHAQNTQSWIESVVQLLARLSSHNIGYIDWEPYLDDIFQSALRNFGLNITGIRNNYPITVGKTSDRFVAEMMAVWIASMLGPKSSTQLYLEKLMTVLQSYCHPSNYGSWQERIFAFMELLAFAVRKRVSRERSTKPHWQTPVPEEWKLTDVEIKRFVSALLPCVLNGMFAKGRSDMACQCLRHLAFLCSDDVVPALLEKLFPALEALTEPHRLTQSLNGLVSVILPLIRNGCRSQVIPIMNGVLPGLDPNDLPKSLLTMQTLCTFMILVPVVDVSAAAAEVEDLTEEEKALCGATRGFVDFVDGFMDRLFAIIRNFSQQSVNQANGAYIAKRNLLRESLAGGFRALVENCSSEIYAVAVDKLHAFLLNNVFESWLTAEMIGDLCYSALFTGNASDFWRFMNVPVKRLKELIDEETYEQQEVNEIVVWHLIICSKIIRSRGDLLTEHSDELIEFLAFIKPLQSKNAYSVVCTIVEKMLTALTGVFLNDAGEFRSERFRSSPDPKQVIQSWGRFCAPANFSWQVPSAKELDLVRKVMDLFLWPELEKLKNPEKLSSQSLLMSLSFVRSCVQGSASVLPLLDGDLVPIVDWATGVFPFSYSISTSNGFSKDGQNIRAMVADVLHGVKSYLCSKTADDTRSLILLCRVFYLLLFFRGISKKLYDVQNTSVTCLKKIMSDFTTGRTRHMRATVIGTVISHHYRRLLEKSSHYFTTKHLAAMKDIFQLATSTYAEVRKEAQVVLFACFRVFPFSYRLMVDDLLCCLKNRPNVDEQQFKGALFILHGATGFRSFVIRRHWETLLKIWPAVVLCCQSEKPSIIRLLLQLQCTVSNHFESFQIRIELSDHLVDMGRTAFDKLITSAPEALPLPTEEQVHAGRQREKSRNEQNQRCYQELILTLVKVLHKESLHWRQIEFAQTCLLSLLRLDEPFPAEAVDVFLSLLCNDLTYTRQAAISFLGSLLKIKRKRPKKLILDTKAAAGLHSDRAVWPIRWGWREDNDFMLYRTSRIPQTEADWNQMSFVHKIYYGFYCWPKEMKAYSGASFAAAGPLTRDQLVDDDDKAIFDLFTNAEWVGKFCGLLCVDDKGFKDQFLCGRYILFKMLFRNFGITFLPAFKPIVEKLMQSTETEKQRLASELVAGIIDGSKLWPYPLLQQLWQWLSPLLSAMLTTVSAEHYKNWGTCVATVFDSRDPYSLHWLIELLMNSVRRSEDSSPSIANRLYILLSGISQHQWRLMDSLQLLLDDLETKLAQPYENLRERMGSCLATVFSCDVEDAMRTPTCAVPDRAAFLARSVAKMSRLKEDIESGAPSDDCKEDPDKVVVNGDRKKAILLFKTLIDFLKFHWSSSLISLPPEVVQLMPYLCYFENETTDNELKESCHMQLIYGMGRSLLVPTNVALLLDHCEEMARNKWWKARVSLLYFLQVCVVSNLYFFCKPAHQRRVQQLVFTLLNDDQIEVREVASTALCTFFQCSFLEPTVDIVEEFRQWASSRAILKRHSGVLGMAAIILSQPYTVSDCLPRVIADFCQYVDSQPPVNTSVRKTLSEFKRTHIDNWPEHMMKFNENQLAALTDALVSPSYYA